MARHGEFFWNELLTNEPERARDFFSELLGWTWNEVDMGHGTYRIAKLGDTNIAGLVSMPPDMPEGEMPRWMSYVQVDDVDAALGRVKALGGTVKKPAFDIEGVGRIAVIADPTGAVLSLMTPTWKDD